MGEGDTVEYRLLDSGDVIGIPGGTFHQVYNRRNHPLVFSCTYKK
jgi:mannose-6-phosphate isomerase-like protein (cupin superfamily)